MKILNIKSLAVATILLVGMTSCDDFLNRPTEDSYTIDGFYQTDAQCFQAVNPIYNSPWYDFQRGFVKIGDVLSGNIYYGTDNAYQAFVLKSSDSDLKNASASLWSVNAYCNTLIENIKLKAGPDVTQTTKNTVEGEALTWKAMTYFYLVRCFGAVPIIHNNSEIIANNQSNSLYRNKIEDVYTYIIKCLDKAIELLPAENATGRIDKYSAYGLLAKVYLTKSGYGSTDGTRNAEDLAKAAEYAKKVIDESGRVLTPEYSDIFRLANNFSDESLIAWHWTIGTHWTCQNTFQSDLGLNGFSELGDTWGTYVGPTVDLQTAFGENASSFTRINTDARRKATMMMQGDHYDYFWADKGGFDYDWNKTTSSDNALTVTFASPTGSNCVKNIVGDNQDHINGASVGLSRMSTALSTHLLRLADVYLVYAEAVLGNSSSTSDASAIDAFYKVRSRSVASYVKPASITFDDIFKERRLELACEGDYWYDFVRLSYYKPAEAKARLAAQERGYWNNLAAYYKGNIDNSTVTVGSWKVAESVIFFEIPFPDTDLSANPNLKKEPVSFDFSSISF
ncbi:MAG: glycan metabolism protein [Bacteroidetes bacterium]|nr:glycan metabolism protein [Bacteroidota bacterium]